MTEIQGGASVCTLHFVDIKSRVTFASKEEIRRYCDRTFVLKSTKGCVQTAVPPCIHINVANGSNLSPVGHDAEEDLPELGARLVVLRRHVRHQVHDQSPDDVVVDDPGEKEGKTPYRPVAKETSATQNLNCLSHRSTSYSSPL